MRVAIDTRALRPPLAGIGHFAHRLMDAMLPLRSCDEELLSFNGWRIQPLDRNFLTRIDVLNSKDGSKYSLESVQRAAKNTYVFLRRRDAVRRSVRALQARCFHGAEKHFDVFHAVNYVPPATFHKPVLPFIHDLSHIRYPKMHPKERVEWLETQLKLLADVPYVQTNSQFSKGEIVTVLGLPADRIYVTYAAPGAQFRRDRDGDEFYLAKHQLASRKYVLAVGTREPRKNFRTIAAAYTALPAVAQAQFPLVWAGPPGWGDLALSSAAERAKEMGRIRVIGYVPDRELAALYRNAALFVMASIYEGFGMPVVEAMACGARIALSRIPVFEEIATGCARYVEPMDVEGWRQALKDAIDGGHEAASAPAPQPDLARFSWHASAATTLDLYRRLAGGRSGASA
jgi:glycosyltransferase involved in cell wall biosynthesis